MRSRDDSIRPGNLTKVIGSSPASAGDFVSFRRAAGGKFARFRASLAEKEENKPGDWLTRITGRI